MQFYKALYDDEREIDGLLKNFKEKPLVICCCGGVGVATLLWAQMNKIEIAALADNDFDKQNKTILGYRINSVDEAAKKFGNDVNYITAALIKKYNINRQIYMQLRELGIRNLNIYDRTFIEHPLWGEGRFDYYRIRKENAYKIILHEGEIDNVIKLLQDELSVCVYTKMLSRFFHGYYYTIDESNYDYGGYFDHDFFSYDKGEVLIQCGVFDGQTIMEFKSLCPDYEKIIGIEADQINYLNSLYVTRERDIRLMLNAVTEERGWVSFDSHGSISRITDSGDIKVQGIRGDDLNVKPTMIQMDIEGGELNALKGFKNIIKECKPKLAICIYHSVEDHWRIPLYIHELVPDYKFYVRNDSRANNNQETVLFAHI